ncbi:MAG: GNAT family N-acetyltransferase [Methanobrevibacter millerae]|uniref:GNAT family N-acetyltransferase n=1 Tax=Methanobrevibacter millerae TaxID=230361 RepID=A0A8T3VAV1_9EURY|nr:GNAT family N-acetyltransferase [Methanobrevibacter millerae]MBE6504857.1 GNAT family N-acetyltransferase [Methanobrevibacter millerae]
MKIREFCDSDVEEMIEIWNEIVEEGIAFPQEDILDLKSGYEFFSSQTYTGVAILDKKIVGLYILHPNNVGRCSHIANASYAVSSDMRGKHIGEKLVLDSLEIAKARGFLILQYNAVVETNYAARHLYEKLGFKQLGIIPKGFKTKDNRFENICPYYIEL